MMVTTKVFLEVELEVEGAYDKGQAQTWEDPGHGPRGEATSIESITVEGEVILTRRGDKTHGMILDHIFNTLMTHPKFYESFDEEILKAANE